MIKRTFHIIIASSMAVTTLMAAQNEPIVDETTLGMPAGEGNYAPIGAMDVIAEEGESVEDRISFEELCKSMVPDETTPKSVEKQSRKKGAKGVNKESAYRYGQSQDLSVDKMSAYVLPSDYYVYSGYDHWATFFSNDCRVVQMEDETRWLVADYDVYKTLSWRSEDYIAIYPNYSYFSKDIYKYRLVNRRNGDVVEAKLTRGPLVGGPFTKMVMAVDAYNSALFLTDGTQWSVRSGDYSELRKWQVNDFVIIAINDGFWSGYFYPTVLINVTRNEYVFAKIQ